jgi:hypothetical protein
MHDSPYDSEEEVDALFAREVAVEYKDFGDEILEESSEATQRTTETSLAISRDSNTISGGGSNSNSGVQSTPNWQSAGTPLQRAAKCPMLTAADGRMKLTPSRQSSRTPMQTAAENPMQTVKWI